MTSIATAPTSGLSARKVKPAFSGADRVFGFPLRSGGLLILLIMTTIGSQFAFAPAASAQGYVPISGAGSTWSANAIDQWRRNIDNQLGLKVSFAATGSSDGRNQFKNGTVDFAVSELEYGLNDGGVIDQPPQRAFGYLPIVADGTAFMYNLKIGNKRVTDLRLSGEVLAKIFTQQITNWADPAIKADNPGLTLPERPIVPVVRSDGAGTTAQFTRWLAARHAGIWDAYCDKAGKRLKPCGFTSFYPITGGIEAKSGSQGVAGFVAQNSSEGSITYVEYSYARNAKFPVAKVLNEAGYYVEPTAASVSVALLNAAIRPDLTADLSGVYTDGDKRAYPLSSYSYMIIPKDTTQNFSNEKGRSLSEFAYYFLCEGQQQADALGYAPLPINLVQAGLDQVAQIPGSTQKLNRDDLQQCNNPTFSPDGTNLLARDAPQPPECDRKGPAQCTGGAETPTPGGPPLFPGGPPASPPGGPPLPPPSGPPPPTPGGPPPPRGPPASPPGGTSCLAAIHLLGEGLPRAVGVASLRGNGQWVWQVRWVDEIIATAIRTYQRHLRDRLRCDSLVGRVIGR
ncbi:MAG: phosphate ABC transporter substrate-binding protein PstS [Pseudonocardiaceae bacterium]